MDHSAAPIPRPVAAALATAGEDEDIPLGWECANPALQIDCWADEEGAAPAVGAVSTS